MLEYKIAVQTRHIAFMKGYVAKLQPEEPVVKEEVNVTVNRPVLIVPQNIPVFSEGESNGKNVIKSIEEFVDKFE